LNHLKQIGKSWYARIVVPARQAIGTREYTIALGTRDVAVTKRTTHAYVAKVMAEFQAADAHRELPPEAANYIQNAARVARDAVASGIAPGGR
jgi:hypothetical protein